MFRHKTRQKRIITGLDIGTTKVCAIIGQTDAEGKLEILGMGSSPSKGLCAGEITEIQPTVEAIENAIDRAVGVANVPVSDVWVGIAGQHVRSMNRDAVIEIRHPTRGIDEKDRERAIQRAINVSLPDDETLIQHVVQEFRINGTNRTVNPVGLCGSSLQVHAHLVVGGADPLHNIVKSVRRACRCHPHVVLQSLASAMSVLTPSELELGVALVDIGGGTTDVALIFGGAVRATGEIAIGGDYITRDIAEVLSCPPQDAENIKKQIGCALPEMVDRERTFALRSAGDPEEVKMHEEYLLAQVIEARLDDIFERVNRFIEQSGYRDRLHAGLVLTGGTALLPGIVDVAQCMVEKQCRCGSPQGLRGFAHVVSSPIYATGVGLIQYAMEEVQQVSGGRGRWRRFLDYIDETFA